LFSGYYSIRDRFGTDGLMYVVTTHAPAPAPATSILTIVLDVIVIVIIAIVVTFFAILLSIHTRHKLRPFSVNRRRHINEN
jgi:hypothetical protein